MSEYPTVSKKFARRVKTSGLKSKIKMFAITAFFVFMAISFFWGEFGFLRMWILGRKIDKLQQDIRVLKVQRHDILWETDKIKNDQAYIMRYAVETFGYARPDQKVIQFVHKDSPLSAKTKQVSNSGTAMPR